MRRTDFNLGTPTPTPLPSGYTRLQYIECSGDQYINTGVKPNASFKWHYVFQWLDAFSGDTNYNGCENWISTSSDVIIRVAYRSDSNRGRIIIYGDFDNFKSYTGNDYPYMDITTYYFENGHQYIDNVEVAQGVITRNNSSTYIFFFANDGSYGHDPYHKCKQGRVYYSWMKYGDTLIREFIPALRVSDSKPGLYDTVNDVFYTNAGSGEFNYA